MRGVRVPSTGWIHLGNEMSCFLGRGFPVVDFAQKIPEAFLRVCQFKASGPDHACQYLRNGLAVLSCELFNAIGEFRCDFILLMLPSPVGGYAHDEMWPRLGFPDRVN